MKKLSSYWSGQWHPGVEKSIALINPTTEETVAEVQSAAIDWPSALRFAAQGGAALRQLTFAARAEKLKAASKLIHGHRDELIGLAIANGGNTRSDAKFDIDGASGTLAAYADWGSKIGQTTILTDGDPIQLTRSVRFYGQHVWAPRQGVAVHINAFNFPAWNMAEKAACAILAGVPVVTKPATATALVAHRIVELLLENKIFPDGVVTLVMGSVGDLFDHLSGQDVVAFTGSNETGTKLRSHPRVLAESVRFNVEADSLNSAILGADVTTDTPVYSMFIADVTREMTQKTGQKCTAIRRVFVPQTLLESVRSDLSDRLSQIKVGDPALDEVTMGPLASRQQVDEVKRGIGLLLEEAQSVFGETGEVTPKGVATNKGFFVGPVLLELKNEGKRVHEHEVFGPVATLIPYADTETLVAAVKRGKGSLVSSLYSDDRGWLKTVTADLAPYHGRLFLGSSKLEGHSLSPGTVLPSLNHGGPGRAGGGEELGGLHGLHFYMQRTAIAGDRPILEGMLGTTE